MHSYLTLRTAPGAPGENAGTNPVPRPTAPRGSWGRSHPPGALSARVASSPARRRPSSPPSSSGKGGGRRPGRGGRSRSPAAAADVAAAGAVEESTRARSLRGGSEPGPGPGQSRRHREPLTCKATKAEPLPRPRPPSRHPAASPADLGRGSWEGPQKGGVSAEFSLLTFNLGTRCLGMRRNLQRRPELSAPRANTSPGDHRLEPPGSDTRCWARTPSLPPRAAAGFPSGCDQGGGKDRGRSKEPGREAGGWGGAGDQVIRRIINLDGSLEEKKSSGDFPTPGRKRRKPAAVPGSGAEPRLALPSPGGSKLRKPRPPGARGGAPVPSPAAPLRRSLQAPGTSTCRQPPPELLRCLCGHRGS